MPIAGSGTLAENVAVGSRRARTRTQIGDIHQAWESDDPVVHGVNDVTTVELEAQRALGT